MKICHIINNLKGGGAQNVVISLAISQARIGHKVFLVILDRDDLEYSIGKKKKLVLNSVEIFSLNRKVSDILSLMKTLIKGLYIINKMRPDVINTHLELSHIYGGIFNLLLFKRKTVLVNTIHNAPEKWNIICKMLNNRKPKIYCSISAKETNKYYHSESIVIDNGIEKPPLCFNTTLGIRKELNIDRDSKLIISVGSLREQKNYNLTIEIAKNINNKIHFLICGGSYNKYYQSPSIFKSVPNMHYLGLRDDVRMLLNECNCFLSCSTYEGLPIAVLEAFFSGIPCVLSPIPQHIDIIRDIDACFISKDYNPDSFINEIYDVLKYEKTKNEIYNNREVYIRKYLIENTSDKYLNFYKQIAK